MVILIKNLYTLQKNQYIAKHTKSPPRRQFQLGI